MGRSWQNLESHDIIENKGGYRSMSRYIIEV